LKLASSFEAKLRSYKPKVQGSSHCKVVSFSSYIASELVSRGNWNSRKIKILVLQEFVEMQGIFAEDGRYVTHYDGEKKSFDIMTRIRYYLMSTIH